MQIFSLIKLPVVLYEICVEYLKNGGWGQLLRYISASQVCGNIMAKEYSIGRSVIVFSLGCNEELSFNEEQ